MRIITLISQNHRKKMRVIIEKGDKPELRELVYNLRRCGLKIDVRNAEQDKVRVSLSNDDIRTAIVNVTASFTVSTQWAAIYRVLVDFCGYPEEITSFCREIEKLMKGVDLSYPCNYQSIQKTLSSRAIFQKNYSQWKEQSPLKRDKTFQRQMKVADSLLRCLEKGGL